jgi:hypothetical protein
MAPTGRVWFRKSEAQIPGIERKRPAYSKMEKEAVSEPESRQPLAVFYPGSADLQLGFCL